MWMKLTHEIMENNFHSCSARARAHTKVAIEVSSIIPQKERKKVEQRGAIIEVWELNIGKFVMYRWNSSRSLEH